jgi:putative methionine-R-sulfoxide reductase with GAF domain
MPHADASYVPESASVDKAAFYRHLYASLDALLTEGTNWISALSNCSSLLYFSYLSSSLYGPEYGPHEVDCQP